MFQLASPLRATCCLLAVGFVLGAVAPVAADHHGESSFVIKAGRVLPASGSGPWSIDGGIIVVREGRIVAVGAEVDIPPDLPVYDLPDVTVMPGLIAAVSPLVSRHTGSESIAAGFQAIDGFDAYDPQRTLLAGGVTTAHLSPGDHRLVTGQGAVVKLGGPDRRRVLLPQADLTVNFIEEIYQPPNYVRYQAPSGSDVALPEPMRQRPDSRLGQFLAIDEALASSEPSFVTTFHGRALAEAWKGSRPVRVQAHRGADLAGAVAWMRRHQRKGYLVGGAEADRVAEALSAANMPLVFQLGRGFRTLPPDLGFDPDALAADVDALQRLKGIKVALAVWGTEHPVDLRLLAATAQRAGMSPASVVEAVTRIPAEILGVDDRVGSLVPGKDADLALYWGDPLSTSASLYQVYIGGRLAFEPPPSKALVVRAGTIWINEEKRIQNGEVLIEDGRIVAVGSTVPRPRFSRIIDAGSDGFVTPGLIDARGHLGLEGDRTATGPELSLAGLVGVPDLPERRVARSGVTSVVLSPYSAAGQGSQVSVVRMGGSNRDQRVVRSTAGVYFDQRGSDPSETGSAIKRRLEAGKKYIEIWQKYYKELAEWKEQQAKGVTVEEKPAEETVEAIVPTVDPLTGTWSVTISGPPLPEPQSVTMKLRLTGTSVEGRIMVPGEPEEAKVVGTFEDNRLSAVIDVDTGGMGQPQIEAELVEEDHLVGTLSFQNISIDLDAKRTDKEPVEFKVVKRRTRGKDGRPIAPKVDEGLEPIRAVLEQRIPLVVGVSTAAQIASVLEVAKEFDVSLILLDAEEAAAHAERLADRRVGVILPRNVLRWRHDTVYHQADDLARRGVRIAFQSGAEDGARGLPMLVLHAVDRGLSADAALAAMTTQASRMFMLQDELGSLEPGLLGDLVIFSGHPFEAGSRVLRVIVNGEEIR